MNHSQILPDPATLRLRGLSYGADAGVGFETDTAADIARWVVLAAPKPPRRVLLRPGVSRAGAHSRAKRRVGVARSRRASSPTDDGGDPDPDGDPDPPGPRVVVETPEADDPAARERVVSTLSGILGGLLGEGEA